MGKGNPRCMYCQGRGGFRGPYGWQRCECMKVRAVVRKQQQRINSIGAKNEQLDFSGMRYTRQDKKGNEGE